MEMMFGQRFWKLSSKQSRFFFRKVPKFDFRTLRLRENIPKLAGRLVTLTNREQLKPALLVWLELSIELFLESFRPYDKIFSVFDFVFVKLSSHVAEKFTECFPAFDLV